MGCGMRTDIDVFKHHGSSHVIHAMSPAAIHMSLDVIVSENHPLSSIIAHLSWISICLLYSVRAMRHSSGFTGPFR